MRRFSCCRWSSLASPVWQRARRQSSAFGEGGLEGGVSGVFPTAFGAYGAGLLPAAHTAARGDCACLWAPARWVRCSVAVVCLRRRLSGTGGCGCGWDRFRSWTPCRFHSRCGWPTLCRYWPWRSARLCFLSRRGNGNWAGPLRRGAEVRYCQNNLLLDFCCHLPHSDANEYSDIATLLA